jgi:hypothetical protein
MKSTGIDDEDWQIIMFNYSFSAVCESSLMSNLLMSSCLTFRSSAVMLNIEGKENILPKVVSKKYTL